MFLDVRRSTSGLGVHLRVSGRRRAVSQFHDCFETVPQRTIELTYIYYEVVRKSRAAATAVRIRMTRADGPRGAAAAAPMRAS